MKLGVNAMSMIKVMYEDFEGCVQRLKKGGVDYIEAMSDWGADPKQLEFYAKMTGAPSGWDPENTLNRLEYLRSQGMDMKGMFVFDDRLDEQIDAMGEYCQKAGLVYVVVSFLHYDGLDDIYEKAEKIKQWGRCLKKYGVQLTMHNHEHDMVKIADRDGQEKYIMDIFLEQCSADELMLEVDTGWLVYAGVDAAAYVKEHIDRIMILHFKDICREYKTVDRQDIFVACGEGAVDFKAVLDAVPENRKEAMLYVLDQDASKGDIVEDQIKSVRYLKGL